MKREDVVRIYNLAKERYVHAFQAGAEKDSFEMREAIATAEACVSAIDDGSTMDEAAQLALLSYGYAFSAHNLAVRGRIGGGRN